MKILFINDYAKKAGGAEKHIYQLMENLNSKGHDARLFALEEKDAYEDKVYIHQRKLSPRRLLFDASAFISLEHIVKEFRPDILHLHNTIFFSVYFHSKLARLNMPIVKTVHDYRMVCPSGWLVLPDNKICGAFKGKACFENKCIKFYNIKMTNFYINIMRSKIERENIDLFITPSKALKETLLKNRITNVYHLPNFVSCDIIENVSTMGEKTILYAGRLSREKGVHILVSAMQKVLKVYPEVQLIIAGEGQEKENLKKQAKELKIEKNISFLGYVENIKKFYKKAYFVVIPSLWMENFCTVALEAMAHGKSIVASRIGGFPEIIEDGKNGFLFNPGDKDVLAKVIIRLLEEPELVQKMRCAAKNTIGKYTPDVYLAKLLELYRSVLGEKIER